MFLVSDAYAFIHRGSFKTVKLSMIRSKTKYITNFGKLVCNLHKYNNSKAIQLKQPLFYQIILQHHHSELILSGFIKPSTGTR